MTNMQLISANVDRRVYVLFKRLLDKENEGLPTRERLSLSEWLRQQMEKWVEEKQNYWRGRG